MKAVSMREMSVDELSQQLEDTQKELFNLKIQQSTSQLEQPLQIRKLRRDIARVRTVLRERRGE